jgi:hypothetical protein
MRSGYDPLPTATSFGTSANCWQVHLPTGSLERDACRDDPFIADDGIGGHHPLIAGPMVRVARPLGAPSGMRRRITPQWPLTPCSLLFG